MKPFLKRVQIGVSAVAVVVKTKRLALTVVVSLCQCREVDVKEEQRVYIPALYEIFILLSYTSVLYTCCLQKLHNPAVYFRCLFTLFSNVAVPPPEG